eukprot:gene9077-biopygen5752
MITGRGAEIAAPAPSGGAYKKRIAPWPRRSKEARTERHAVKLVYCTGTYERMLCAAEDAPRAFGGCYSCPGGATRALGNATRALGDVTHALGDATRALVDATGVLLASFFLQ